MFAEPTARLRQHPRGSRAHAASARSIASIAGLLLATALRVAAAPALVCAQPDLDLGAVTGTAARAHFTIANGGDEPLAITRVRACCGATCSLGPTNLPPGGSVDARVVVDIKGRSGTWRKTFYIFCNDPAQPIVALRLAGSQAGPGATDDFDATAWERQLGRNTRQRPTAHERE